MRHHRIIHMLLRAIQTLHFCQGKHPLQIRLRIKTGDSRCQQNHLRHIFFRQIKCPRDCLLHIPAGIHVLMYR
ncbi:hypothetical protein D3C71_1881130 [compost metagenome]